MRPRLVLLICSLGLALGSPSRLRADPPTHASATYDLSSPRAAAASFARAADAGDANALRAIMFADSGASRRLADALTEFILAARRVAAASHQRWGGHATLPDTAAAPLAQDGDRATVGQPGQPGALSFRKIDDRWLLDPFDFVTPAGSDSADESATVAQIELMHQLAVALNDAADDIAADRYRTADDAESAVRQKLRAVVGHTYRHLPATTAPTTAASRAR